MSKKYFSTVVVICGLLLVGCGSKKTVIDETETNVSEEITITKSQFTNSGMKVGNPEPTKFQMYVKASGYIAASPSGTAQVSALIPGRIKEITVNTGVRVNKGQMLCIIESTEFIRHQQTYAELCGRLKAVESEYERQKALAGENIASQKTYQNAESEYNSLKASCEGLKTQLGLLGLKTEKTANGLIVQDMIITAPIDGYVSALHSENGAYADPQKILFELVDLNQLQLKLAVFEKDFASLTKGLNIDFYSPNNPDKVYRGTLTSYGRSINPETRAITVIGSILPDDRTGLINGMYLEAKILTGEREVMALPDEAILKSGDAHLVLVQKASGNNNLTFIRKEVNTGISINGFTEILNPEGLKQVLVKGGFNLVMD